MKLTDCILIFAQNVVFSFMHVITTNLNQNYKQLLIDEWPIDSQEETATLSVLVVASWSKCFCCYMISYCASFHTISSIMHFDTTRVRISISFMNKFFWSLLALLTVHKMTAVTDYFRFPPEWLREVKKHPINAVSPARSLLCLINEHKAQWGIQNCKNTLAKWVF